MINSFKILFPLALVALLSSCGTTQKGQKKISAEDSEEFSWIENADFNPKKQTPFQVNNDNYPEETKKIDSLSVETLARLPDAKLEDVGSDNKDKLATAISSCYVGNFQKGFQLLDKLYSTHKEHPGYWNQVGTCYFLKGEERKALLFYNKARGFKKNYAPPINNLGVIYTKNGKFQKALAAFELAVKSNHFSLTPLFNKASLKLRFGFVNEACQTFYRLYQRNNSDPDVLNALGTCQLFKGKYKKANSFFKQMGDEYYRRPDMALNYVLSLKLSGNNGKAKDIFEDIQKDSTKGFSSYYEKIKNYLGM